MSTGVTRWLYWMEAIEKAGLGDFPRLARLAQGNSIMIGLLANRWVELDPRHMFDSINAGTKSGRALPSEFESVLFNEWLKRDPDAVIAALNGPEVFGNRAQRRMRVALRFLENNDVERGLRLMSEWNIDYYAPSMTSVAKWAAANPRHAAEFALAYPSGIASRMTLETIGREWAKTDPNAALQFAMSKGGELGSTLADAALKAWGERNLNAAGDWLSTVDASTRNRLYPAFVEAWGKQDAGSALNWCEQNLAGSSLVQAVTGLFQSAAAKDVSGAAGMVAAMQPSPARSEAALAVAQKWLPEYLSDKPAEPETIAWLKSLDNKSLTHVLSRTATRWADSDSKSMADLLTSLNGEHIPTRIYSILALSMARNNPSEALEWAGQLPRDRALSVGSEAFTQWRRSQPEAATQWLNGLPSNDERRQPFFNSAIQSIAHDPHAADQLAALSGAEREAARAIIESMRLANDRRARLLDVLKTP
jgi:hypothetical protein